MDEEIVYLPVTPTTHFPQKFLYITTLANLSFCSYQGYSTNCSIIGLDHRIIGVRRIIF